MGGPVAAALAAALLAPGAARAREVELDGRLSLRGLYSADDSGDNPAVGMSFLEADARADDVTGTGLRLALDATFLLDVTRAEERRFGRTESFDQVRQLYAEQPEVLGRLDIAVGRRLILEAGHAWVDGGDVRLHLDEGRSRVGVYGGLSPDRHDYALTTRYQATGAYATLQREGLDAAVAFNALLRDGHPDREWAFNRIHYRIAPGLFVASYLIVDFAERPAVTTLLASVDYTPVPALNLALNYSRYAVEQYRDQTIFHDVIEPNQALLLGDEVVDLVYDRVRFSAGLRFHGRWYHYQSVEFKSRTQDDRDAWFYTIGLRNEDLFGAGTRVDLGTTLANNFQSDSYVVALLVDQDVGDTLGLSGRFTWFDGRTVGRTTDRGRLFDEAQRIVLMGGAVSWRPHPAHQIDLDYDGVYEAELQDVRNQENLFIHTWMGRYAYRF